jgi:hypothetical protein
LPAVERNEPRLTGFGGPTCNRQSLRKYFNFKDHVDPAYLGVSYYLAVLNVPVMVMVHALTFAYLLRLVQANDPPTCKVTPLCQSGRDFSAPGFDQCFSAIGLLIPMVFQVDRL